MSRRDLCWRDGYLTLGKSSLIFFCSSSPATVLSLTASFQTTTRFQDAENENKNIHRATEPRQTTSPRQAH